MAALIPPKREFDSIDLLFKARHPTLGEYVVVQKAGTYPTEIAAIKTEWEKIMKDHGNAVKRHRTALNKQVPPPTTEATVEATMTELMGLDPTYTALCNSVNVMIALQKQELAKRQEDEKREVMSKQRQAANDANYAQVLANTSSMMGGFLNNKKQRMGKLG
jgi:hypothetical protein